MQQSAVSSAALLLESSHAIGQEPSVLDQILYPGVNLGLWQRPADAEITEELSSLKASDLPDMRCMTSPKSFDDDVRSLLQQRNIDPFAYANWRSDLRQLADYFFCVHDNRDVTIRLVTTNEDGCRRFHSDRTHLRLLCTYHGPGTEWLANEQVDRLALANGLTNEEIMQYAEPLEFAPFWVGIMKGEAYPDNKGQGLVHRSPPIAGSGKIRVLFCLDC